MSSTSWLLVEQSGLVLIPIECNIIFSFYLLINVLTDPSCKYATTSNDFVRDHEQQQKIEYNTNNGHNGIAENGFSCEDDNSAPTSSEYEIEEDDKIHSSNPNDDGDDI
ncbi:hypothetical protein Tco_0293463, partial [Tanacetum coccineum]